MKYLSLAETYQQLESTSKRLDKTTIVAQFLQKTKVEDLEITTLLLQGIVFPIWDSKRIGIADRLVLKAINISTGISLDDLEKLWKKTGDLGLVAEQTIATKKQATLFSSPLQVKKVFSNLQKLATIEGTGTVDSKLKIIAELLTSASHIEAKYITRTLLEDLRIGVGDGVIRDSFAYTYLPKLQELELGESNKEYLSLSKGKTLIVENKEELTKKRLDNYGFISINDPDKNKQRIIAREIYNYFLEQIDDAYSKCNDWSKVAAALAEKGLAGLQTISLTPGNPIKPMLFQKAKDIKDAFAMISKPAAFEYKYDGFRLQIHIYRGDIQLFTRGFENVTAQFPDVVKTVKEHITADYIILDGEAVGYDKKTNKYLPFQHVSQRIKRKFDIEKLAKEFPVELNLFDIMYYNGKSTIEFPFHERRALLNKIIEPKARAIVLSQIIVTDNEEEATKFYHKALDAGEEGIMGKNLDGIYKPGSRVGFGVKIKPVMESLDLVITGAEWGEGKRTSWLTSFTLACIDENGDFLEIGKVGTGFKELEGEGVTFQQMTELLKQLIISEKGKVARVKPKIVIEVNFEEIQVSPSYSSGFALRFPRVVRLREDRRVDEISDLRQIKEMFGTQ
ncbi:ATP-dependent DNA ligase [Candidatus Woesearchaeota archaeon]|nr:ATP-dependent DNA ligase [Candidatus Woesearchaeota archaeon]